jgi:hypothetical protein
MAQEQHQLLDEGDLHEHEPEPDREEVCAGAQT